LARAKSLRFWSGGRLSSPKREDQGSIPCGVRLITILFWLEIVYYYTSVLLLVDEMQKNVFLNQLVC
jgi:hypothetical protein